MSDIDVTKLTDEEIMKIELGFFKRLKAVDTTRDYSIIVDMSGSMTGSRWEQARDAVAFLAPHAVKVTYHINVRWILHLSQIECFLFSNYSVILRA